MDSFDENASFMSNLSRRSEPVHQYSSSGYSKKGKEKRLGFPGYIRCCFDGGKILGLH